MIEGARWRRWVFFHIPLTLFIVGLLFPFYWMIVTTVRPDSELYRPWNAANYTPFWTLRPTLEHIRDLLAEMVPDADQRTAEFRALVRQQPGGAITCPYCQRPVEYAADGQTLVTSSAVPLRYSRAKMERRAHDYGHQKRPPRPDLTPEEWIAEEKLMPGALNGYRYVEDSRP